MKKLLCFILAILFVLPLSACSNEPVEFSEDLRKGRKCFIDVLEIIPERTNSYEMDLYCRCICENGKSVWMLILDFEYIEYFAPEFEEDEHEFYPQKIKFDEPLRINGKVIKVENDIEDGKTVKAFGFMNCDKEAASQYSERSLAGVDFDSDLSLGTMVYADIVRVEPKEIPSEHISSENLSITVYSYLCECTTSSGDTVYMLAEDHDYAEYFDGLASNPAGFFSPLPDAIDLVEAVKVYGYVIDSSDKIDALSSYSDVGKLIKFGYVDSEAFEAAKLENQPATEYNESSKLGQNVYLEIKSIKAEYEITYFGMGMVQANDCYVCRCERTDGTEVWVCVLKYAYTAVFLDTLDPSVDVTQKIELGSMKIHGTIKATSELSDELPAKIGTDKVIYYYGKY